MISTSATAVKLILAVPQHHACYADHFPDNPLVPGALLLKWVFASVENALACKIVRVKQIKFLAIVKPGDQLNIIVDVSAGSLQLSLVVFVQDILVIKGNVECANA